MLSGMDSWWTQANTSAAALTPEMVEAAIQKIHDAQPEPYQFSPAEVSAWRYLARAREEGDRRPMMDILNDWLRSGI